MRSLDNPDGVINNVANASANDVMQALEVPMRDKFLEKKNINADDAIRMYLNFEEVREETLDDNEEFQRIINNELYVKQKIREARQMTRD